MSKRSKADDLPDNPLDGHCFKANLQALDADDVLKRLTELGASVSSLRLVHEIETSLDKRREGHAWLEFMSGDGVPRVIDYVQWEKGFALTYSRDEYYGMLEIDRRDCRHYTFQLAMGNLANSNSYGPWPNAPSLLREDVPERYQKKLDLRCETCGGVLSLPDDLSDPMICPDCGNQTRLTPILAPPL